MQTKRENYWTMQKMFESRISAGATENCQDGTNVAQKNQRGPTTWKDMLENAWNGIANWQTKRRSNKTKFLILVGSPNQKGTIGK